MTKEKENKKEIKKKPRSIWKFLFRLFFWGIFSLGILLVAAGISAVVWWNWYLPDYIGEQLLPEFRQQSGLDEVELKIRRIGITGLDLEALTLTGDDGGMLTFDSIRADYVPHLPFRAPRTLDITRLTLAGGDIHLTMKDGAFAIAGCDLDRVLERLAKMEKKTPTTTAPPVTVVLKEVVVRDLRLHLNYEGRRLVIPAAATITSTDNGWKQIRAELTLSPRGQRITATVEYDATTSAATLKGDANLRLESLADLTGTALGGDARLHYELALGFAGDGINALGSLDATLDLGSRSGLPMEFTTPIKVRQNCNLRYRTGSKELHAILDGEMDPAAVAFNRNTIQAKSTDKIRWKFNLSETGNGVRLSGVELTTGPLQAEAYGFAVKAPQLRIERLAGHYTISGSNITAENASQGLLASGINLLIPLPPEKALPATLNVGSIKRNGKELGSTRSSFRLENNEIVLSGDVENKLIPEARIDFRGRVSPRVGRMPDMLFEVNVPPWKPKEPLKLADYHPAFGDALAAGTVSLGGAIRYDGIKWISGVQLLLEDGAFQWPEHKLNIEGIRLDLRLNDLLNWSTPGSQTLRVKKLRSGTLDFSNLQLRFNIASREQADIERISIDWCGGTVMLHALRFNPSNLERLSVSTEVYCENLSLAAIISQLGICNADGNGTLFGKIPVRWSSQRGLAIDASYLYSRPGSSNTIQLKNPEQLAGGMADAALRQSQLDFALEALRDFTYSWARINLTPDGENLTISLLFDGKPNQPLPFAYDEKSGQLRRDPSARATFEGIQLNVNTHLPINRYLQLNELFQKFKTPTSKEMKK